MASRTTRTVTVPVASSGAGSALPWISEGSGMSCPKAGAPAASVIATATMARLKPRPTRVGTEITPERYQCRTGRRTALRRRARRRTARRTVPDACRAWRGRCGAGGFEAARQLALDLRREGRPGVELTQEPRRGPAGGRRFPREILVRNLPHRQPS